jgi:hypothetical protein
MILGICLALTTIALTPAPELDATPPPSPTSRSGSAFIWALVVDQSGICIAGGTIYVVSGPSAGQTFVQDPYCDAWSYSGGVFFGDLSPGVTMTLRASAPGYESLERMAVAASWGQAVEFDLTPVP